MPGLTPQDNNEYVTWESQAGAIVENKDILAKHGLEAPTSYEDLLGPKYKDLIAMPDPKSSGTGYFFKNMANTKGEEAALAYFDQLEKNIKQFPASGSDLIKLLIQGEVAIGLALTFQGVNEINNGLPFEIIYPEEGSPYSLTGAGLFKGREEDSNKIRVFGFLVNNYLIYDKEYNSPEQILIEQTNKIENYPENIKYADMTGIDSIKDKEYLLSLWKY